MILFVCFLCEEIQYHPKLSTARKLSGFLDWIQTHFILIIGIKGLYHITIYGCAIYSSQKYLSNEKSMHFYPSTCHRLKIFHGASMLLLFYILIANFALSPCSTFATYSLLITAYRRRTNYYKYKQKYFLCFIKN